MNPGTILLIAKLLDLIMAGVQWRPEAKEQAEKLSAKLRLMIAEEREPTPLEWDEINFHTDGLIDRLRNA